MSSIVYKEYQLVWDEIDGWSVGSLNNSETYSDMHVIEYAAYEQLKKEMELLDIGYSDKLLELEHEYIYKIENLTTTLKDAKSALEIASDYMNDEGQDPTYLESVISKIGDI
jgi:hypothetical protein